MQHLPKGLTRFNPDNENHHGVFYLHGLLIFIRQSCQSIFYCMSWVEAVLKNVFAKKQNRKYLREQ